MNKIIIYRNKKQTGEIFLKKDSRVWSIGRDKRNDIVLDSPRISRCHAQVIERVEKSNFFLLFDGTVFPESLSKNGIFCQEKRFYSKIVKDQMLITFPDNWELLFVIPNREKKDYDTNH